MKDTEDKPSLRKAQAEERRLQILDTALSVFAEKGFASTSIKDIAVAAGISSGLMYHYFSSKEQLLEAAVEHHSFLAQLREILQNATNQHYRQVVKSISLDFLKLLEQKRELVKIFLQEGSSNANVQKVWFSLANNGIALLKDYVSERIARGELRAHNVEVTARCLFSLLFTFHLTKDIFKTSSISKEVFIDEAVDNLLYGIQSKKE